MNIRCQILVKGRVQGVGFRWFTEAEANKFGLKGYVKNCFDGDVEIEVEGEKEIIEAFVKQLRIGNRLSRIENIFLDWGDCESKYDNFQIKF